MVCAIPEMIDHAASNGAVIACVTPDTAAEMIPTTGSRTCAIEFAIPTTKFHAETNGLVMIPNNDDNAPATRPGSCANQLAMSSAAWLIQSAAAFTASVIAAHTCSQCEARNATAVINQAIGDAKNRIAATTFSYQGRLAINDHTPSQ